MSEDRALNQCKRPLNNEEKGTHSKKRRKEIKMNSVKTNEHKMKKVPRLSPALFCNNCEVHHGHLHQLLKYAVLGNEGSVAQARPPPPCDFIASLVGLNKEEIDSNHLHNSIQGPADQHCNFSPSPLHDAILRKYGHKRHGLTRYLLSEEEMRKNDYPFVGSSDTGNFVHFSCAGEPTDDSPLFGLDCEMCLTSKGDELTRVSLVDASGNSIMDELVKPDNPILNYKTRFSGITRKMLLPVKTKLKDVQHKLRRLLPPDAVLVGHSLHNDLQALQMIHPNVIDTSLLFARSFGRKFKLKFLTQAVLKREIQCDDAAGHNPSEDAAAALQLAQYFIEHGPEKVAQLNLEDIFIDAYNLQSPPAGSNNISESKLNGFTPPLHSEHPGLADSLEKEGRKIVYIAELESVKKNLIPPRLLKNIFCTSDEEVLEKASSVVPLSPVSIVKFQPGSIFSEFSVDTNEKVRCKFEEMMTVFARPFKSGMCLKSVKRHFQNCGPIHSLCIVSDAGQPYVCIKYSVLEAAQLAVDLLDGTYIDGCCITVQRLISSRTPDFEAILKEMEEDPENKDTIYVAGFMKPLTEAFLQQKFSHFKDIKSIFVPTNPLSQRLSKYCYLKFLSPDSAAAAADYIQAHGGLRSLKALTSCHLHHWLQTAASFAASHKQSTQEIPPEKDHMEIIKDMDRKINRLYERLLENTLCVILFPGSSSINASLPGFGLMGIKTDHL
ncbi:RNA exonuclease 5 [Mixophyes fleayi]|uniref:RNA exonuclease 5 n=1 Tax=Mixophyes fleayi TaxID=3061075 RepID=UPI003F4D8CA4